MSQHTEVPNQYNKLPSGAENMLFEIEEREMIITVTSNIPVTVLSHKLTV